MLSVYQVSTPSDVEGGSLSANRALSLSLSWGSEVIFADKTENTAGQCCHCTVEG